MVVLAWTPVIGLIAYLRSFLSMRCCRIVSEYFDVTWKFRNISECLPLVDKTRKENPNTSQLIYMPSWCWVGENSCSSSSSCNIPLVCLVCVWSLTLSLAKLELVSPFWESCSCFFLARFPHNNKRPRMPTYPFDARHYKWLPSMDRSVLACCFDLEDHIPVAFVSVSTWDQNSVFPRKSIQIDAF